VVTSVTLIKTAKERKRQSINLNLKFVDTCIRLTQWPCFQQRKNGVGASFKSQSINQLWTAISFLIVFQSIPQQAELANLFICVIRVMTEDSWNSLPVYVQGQYKLDEYLGGINGSGQAHAFKVVDIKTQIPHVIKLYKSTLDKNSKLRAVREKIALLRLKDVITNHTIPILQNTSIVSFEKMSEMKDNAYIVTDYVNKQTLMHHMSGCQGVLI
jgi:hypothetical protein